MAESAAYKGHSKFKSGIFTIKDNLKSRHSLEVEQDIVSRRYIGREQKQAEIATRFERDR